MEEKETFSIGIRRSAFHYELVAYRREHSLSQVDMAAHCSVDFKRYQKFEQLRTFPTEEEANKIGDTIGIEATKLFPKWTFPAYKGDNRLTERIIKVERLALSAPPVLLLEDENNNEVQVEKELLKERLNMILTSLPPREKRVIEERFGLVDGKEKTYEEVGNIFGLSRERIRQIEIRGMKRIRFSRKSSTGKGLKDFL